MYGDYFIIYIIQDSLKLVLNIGDLLSLFYKWILII
jgi:hypothetical protein